VNGSDQITMFLVNSTSFEVATSGAFNLTCAETDEPFKCGLPACYIYAVGPWDATSSAANVILSVRSTNHTLAGTGIESTMSPSMCTWVCDRCLR